MLRFANPSNFLRLAAVLVPAGAVLSALTLTLGLYLAFFVAPADYQQGQTVRIMYVHVPAAWLAMFCWGTMTTPWWQRRRRIDSASSGYAPKWVSVVT